MEIIFCVGISGSGKSTWVRDFIKSNQSFVRINRDDIRTTIVGTLEGYYSNPFIGKKEQIVTHVEHALLMQSLQHRFDIVFDNTNLNIDRLKTYIKLLSNGNDVKIKLFDVSLEQAKKNVMKRDGLKKEQVEYINKQFNQYQEIKQYILDNHVKSII